MDSIRQKLGPLPVWAWAALGLALLLGYMYFTKQGFFSQGGGSATSSDGANQGSSDLSSLLSALADRLNAGSGAMTGPGRQPGQPISGGDAPFPKTPAHPIQPNLNPGGLPVGAPISLGPVGLPLDRGSSQAVTPANFPQWGTVAPILQGGAQGGNAGIR